MCYMMRHEENGITIDLVRYRLSSAEGDLRASQILYEAGEYRGANNRAYYSLFHAINAVHALHGKAYCNLRRASATDALTSGRLAEQNGRPPDNPNSVLQLDHHDIMLGDPLEDCVSRYCIVHDHGLPFVWFPLGTDDRAP